MAQSGLAEMYQEELICDATLIADGQRFPCHRALLAAISPFFRDIFINTWKESSGREVLLQKVAPSTVQSILKYIYTEEIALTPELAPFLFAGASQLQIIPLQNLCCRFLMTNLSVQNCFEMYSLAQAEKSRALLHAVVQLLTNNFDRVSEQGDFLQLDFSTLVTLISSSDLEVDSEFRVYQAVRRWVQGQPSKHIPLLGELMLYVRLPLFGPEEQDELQRDLEQWNDLNLEWKLLDGEERLCHTRGLRKGMYKPHIVCIDTQMCEYQELESEEAHMGCYEPQTELWEKLPGLQSLMHACCAAASEKIYVSGGVCRNSYSDAVYEFSAFKSEWSQLPSMGMPRAAHGFLFHNQKLYAMGGWRKFQSFLDLAEAFDLVTGMWAAIANLPFALSHPASTVFRNKLYLLGGATGISTHWLFHRGILIYETSSNTWSQVPLATGFFAAGAVAGDTGIYVIGGYSEKKTHDWVEGALVPENRHSTRKCFFVNEAGRVSYSTGIPKLPRGIANAGVVCCGKRIYVLGGEDLTQRYKMIYHWEPGEPRWRRCMTEIPVAREGISRFGCVTLMRPNPNILQLFQVTSLVLVSAVSK
ncbi:kelch-like protein 24 [Rhineura floridana]|uniref:kelch-like protein 24 n=1 Tax=Rhineura floridana TaxID=261503 RepID=UPI002AC7F33F|nr:kelch-like protein 24 [Rhineura floridana]